MVFSATGLLGLDFEETSRPEFVDFMSGNRLFPGSEPLAHCYCGHQFGWFSGQLGDGAAVTLGEVILPRRFQDKEDVKEGEMPQPQTHSSWELQLKGSGLTPYSRQGDGRKVLRSSIREFLCSEALWGLGVPTTRAATVITSDTW